MRSVLDRGVSPGVRRPVAGAGSGSRAGAAVLLGAAHGTAVESDELSAEALHANLQNNGGTDLVAVLIEWADAEKLEAWGPVDGLVANLETGLLRPLIGGFRAAVRPGGWLVLSGILDHECDELREETEQLGFTCRAIDRDGEWRSLLFDSTG